MTGNFDAAALAEQYGMSYALFESDPHLKKLLAEAVDGNWSTQVFQAKLKNSDWWKANSDTMRQALDLKASDPATWKANLAAAKAQLHDQAVQMGAVISDGSLAKLAQKAVTFGWNAAQVKDYLGAYVKFNEDHVLGGQAGQAYAQISQFAYANGVKLSADATKNYAAYVTRGVTSMEDVMAHIRTQAAGAYPAFADQIAAGASVDDLLQPYRQAMAKEMEVPDTSIDAFTPEIRRALNSVGKDGQVSPMSLADFTTQLRQSADWRKTQRAQDQVMATGHQVLKQLGLMS